MGSHDSILLKNSHKQVGQMLIAMLVWVEAMVEGVVGVVVVLCVVGDDGGVGQSKN